MQLKLQKNLILIFQQVNNLFIQKEKDNILRNINERNLCGNLKSLLESNIQDTKFKDYYVDIEYNRNYEYVKAIINDNFEKIPITPDIIIHSRGTKEKDNLICLEMKKSTAPKIEKQKDRNKLIALTRKPYDGVWSYDGKANPEYVCDYALGIYYEINIKKRLIQIEYYVDGRILSKEEIIF